MQQRGGYIFMIKVLANKSMAFERGEKDKHGQLVRVKTTIGFCELPDWVAKTEFYKMGIADGSLQTFTASSESEEILKLSEKKAALQLEIRALEEKKELVTPKIDKKDLKPKATLKPAIYYKDGDKKVDKSIAEAIPVVFQDTRKDSEAAETLTYSDKKKKK